MIDKRIRRAGRRAASRFLIGAALCLAAAAGSSCDDDGTYHPEGVGNACTNNEDCPTGTCYLGPGGGYCTAPCNNEGSTAECPIDTVCKPIQGGPRRCLLICGTEHYCPFDDCETDWCPPGSSCVDVSESLFRGCEPNPQ